MIKLHYPEGMRLHGENACKHLGYEKYDWKTDRDKTAIFWLYTEDDYKYLGQHTGRRIVFWNGSDVLHLANKFSAKYINLVRDTSIVHACQNPIMQAELAAMGIYAVVRFTFFNDIEKYKLESNLTRDVYMCANPGRGIEYGEAIFNALAWQFPGFTFHIFGVDPLVPTYCDNVKYYGWISEDEMDEITRKFAVCFRYNRHDGFPQIVCKALLRGHNVITTLPYEGLTTYCDNYFKVVTALNTINDNFDQLYSHGVETKVKQMINLFDYAEGV